MNAAGSRRSREERMLKLDVAAFLAEMKSIAA
jgi:hypothetical protein